MLAETENYITPAVVFSISYYAKNVYYCSRKFRTSPALLLQVASILQECRRSETSNRHVMR